jgi:hypothetical protein
MFGHRLHLNYNGYESQKTYFGAILSVLALLIITSLIFNKFRAMIYNE